MLQFINSSETDSNDKLFSAYPKCKYILRDYTDDSGKIYGKLYAVSTSVSTNKELYAELHKLRKQGVVCMVDGDYGTDGGMGVQYQIEK